LDSLWIRIDQLSELVRVAMALRIKINELLLLVCGQLFRRFVLSFICKVRIIRSDGVHTVVLLCLSMLCPSGMNPRSESGQPFTETASDFSDRRK
jgi:hypothetical protein